MLAFFGERLMGYRWDQPAYSLSYANRRRLEIARATATNPRLLLLDEPAAGMNPKETHEITELIGKLRDEGGYTILVIEHDMHVVEGVSDRVIALDHGIKIAEGTFEQVATDPKVVEAYLGTGGRAQVSAVTRAPAAAAPARGDQHLLRADPHPPGLEHGRRRRRARLPAGRQRVGKVDDAEDDPRHRAAALRPGRALRRGRDEDPPRTGSSAGWRSCPENRRLFGPMTVLENLEMGAYLRPKADLREDFERVYSLFPLLYERRAQYAGTLSGGSSRWWRWAAR